MKKQLLVGLSLVLSLSAQAAFIVGSGQISKHSSLDLTVSDFSPLDGQGGLSEATSVTTDGSLNTSVLSVDGDFALYITPMLAPQLNIPSFNFNTLDFLEAFPSFFSVGGFVFNLDYWETPLQDANGINLLGIGTFTHPDYQTSVGTLSLGFTHSDEPPVAGTSQVNFSGTFDAFGEEFPQETPDGGTTLALLGVAMAGMALIPRRKKA